MKIPIPFGIAGMSIGMAQLGEALGSEGLKEGGQAASKFIKPAVDIQMSGILIKQLKGLKKKQSSPSSRLGFPCL